MASNQHDNEMTLNKTMLCEDLLHNWFMLVCPAAPPKMPSLIRKGGLFTDSISSLWLLLAKGLGIPMGCWWLILYPRILSRKDRPKWGTILGPGAGGWEAWGHWMEKSERKYWKGCWRQGRGGHQRRVICITICPLVVPKELFEGTGNHMLLFLSLNALCFQDINWSMWFHSLGTMKGREALWRLWKHLNSPYSSLLPWESSASHLHSQDLHRCIFNFWETHELEVSS